MNGHVHSDKEATKVLRRIRFSRFGLAENPVGAIVTWQAQGTRLAEVTGTYRRESPAAIMLRTKWFCGEPGPDVAAAAVMLVLPDAPEGS